MLEGMFEVNVICKINVNIIIKFIIWIRNFIFIFLGFFFGAIFCRFEGIFGEMVGDFFGLL